MIRVLIADDHQVLIDGISARLAAEPDMQLVGQALTGTEALAFLQKNLVDVLILDLNLPELDGMAVCKRVQQEHPDVKVLILSMHGDALHIKAAMQHGARGYLLKNTGAQELVYAIKQVQQGENYLGKAVTEALVAHSLHAQAAGPSFLPKLTRREKEVLKLIVAGHTNAEIGEQLHISIKTVDSHRTNLLEKLQANNTASLVRISMEKGLV